MRKTLLAVVLIALGSQALVSQPLLSQPKAATQYIRFGKLIDGQGKVWTNVAVVVENDKILECPTRRFAAGASRGGGSAPLHRHPRHDRRAHPHDLLLGPGAGQQALGAERRAAILRYRFSGSGERTQDARNRSDHGARFRIFGICRRCDARSDQSGRHGGTEDVRGRLWVDRNQPACAAGFCIPARWHGRWRG